MSDCRTLQMHHSDESESSGAWTASPTDSELSVKLCCQNDLLISLAEEVESWSNVVDTSEATQTVFAGLGLVLHASSGALVVIAPHEDLKCLRRYCALTDKGYFTRRCKNLTVWDAELREAFLEFSSPTSDDLWPSDHPDPDARSQPKDGAVIFKASGVLKKGAAKIVGLPLAHHTWVSCGTRHYAALQVATFLDRTIVFVRSDNGSIHALAGRTEEQVLAWQLKGKALCDAGHPNAFFLISKELICKGSGVKIVFQQENPKRRGSVAYARYEKYKLGKTLMGALGLGASRADLQNDEKKGFLQWACRRGCRNHETKNSQNNCSNQERIQNNSIEIDDDPKLTVQGAACDDTGKLDFKAYAYMKDKFPPDLDAIHMDRMRPGLQAGEEESATKLRTWDDARSGGNDKKSGKVKNGAGWIATQPGTSKTSWFNIRVWGSWRLAFILARLQRDVWQLKEQEQSVKPASRKRTRCVVGESAATSSACSTGASAPSDRDCKRLKADSMSHSSSDSSITEAEAVVGGKR